MLWPKKMLFNVFVIALRASCRGGGGNLNNLFVLHDDNERDGNDDDDDGELVRSRVSLPEVQGIPTCFDFTFSDGKLDRVSRCSTYAAMQLCSSMSFDKNKHR